MYLRVSVKKRPLCRLPLRPINVWNKNNQSICLISLALVHLNLPTKTVGVCGIKLFMTLVLISNSPFVHTKNKVICIIKKQLIISH